MTTVAVEPDGTGTGTYVVTVDDGRATTTHAVRVPPGLAASLGCAVTGERALVEASFRFLLEREPATSILRSFSLEVIGTYFPEWKGEMARRLGPGAR